MSSDATYERVFKLLASLSKLLLENKRHLQHVCATLQALVFDAWGWPKFKCWEAICEVGEDNQQMMLVLATLDLSRDDGLIQDIVAAFPDCFSSSEIFGPYPLSAIREEAYLHSPIMREYDGEQKYGDPNRPHWFGVIGKGTKFPIPYVCFTESGGELDHSFYDLQFMLPYNLEFDDMLQGQKFYWRDAQWVVLERNDETQTVVATSVDCIVVDI